MEFKKTALITGAAKGIGRQIAIDMAKLGYNICINYNTSKDEAINLLNELMSNNYSAIIYKADVSDRLQVDNMIDNIITNFGSLDVVINNSGIAQYKLFTDISEEDMHNMINTSIMGTFNVTQSALKKYMLHKKQGAIINISSIWGMVGAACEVHYSTVKAGIIGMTKALAKELALSNITVNAVTPGIIDTDMIRGFNKEEINDMIEQIPLNRLGNTCDVSGIVCFLASNQARYITGQVISPNGGLVI